MTTVYLLHPEQIAATVGELQFATEADAHEYFAQCEPQTRYMLAEDYDALHLC